MDSPFLRGARQRPAYELPDASCGIVNLHLSKRNGYQVETTDMRSKVMSSVAACKVHPVAFGNDGDVSLVK